MRKRFGALIIFCGVIIGVQAQSELEIYQNKYPKKNGVFLRNDQQVNIALDKSGQPLIETVRDEERLFLNENFKYYTEGSVSYSSFTKVKSIDAAVLVPENGKYRKIKVDQIIDEEAHDGSVFHDDLMQKKFYFSGLGKGGKTVLNYTKELTQPHFFGTFYFSSYLPVESSRLVIQTPEDMEIVFTLFGEEQDKVSYSVETKGGKKIHTWEAKNMDDYSVESNSVDVSYFSTHIQVRIGEYMYKNEKKHILRNLDDLYAYYRDFVREVNTDENPELNHLADSITQGITSDSDKVKAIFYWVQDNIKYVAFEAGMGGFIPREAALVCDRKYGDCKDMASILYYMISSIGLPAYYTWIGTRDIPYAYSEVPTPSVDNHMICAYFDGNDYIFLDATGTETPFGAPSSFIQGKEALIGISDTEYKVVKVPYLTQEESVTTDSTRVYFEQGVVKGKAQIVYTGYGAIYMSGFLKNASESQKKEYFTEAFKYGNNKCKVQLIDITGANNRDTPVVVNLTFEIPDYIRENGNELYFNPFLEKQFSGSTINMETNKHDKENSYYETVRNVVRVAIPEGYEVEYIAEDVHFDNPKFNAGVRYKKLEGSNEIEIVSEVEMKHLILKSSDFTDWNQMVKKLNEAYSELIIFKKKN